MTIVNRLLGYGGWMAVCWVVAGCAASETDGPTDPGTPPSEGPLTTAEVPIVAVKGGWLVPTQITREGTPQGKLYVTLAKEDVQVGKASLEGATMANPDLGDNPFGHPTGYYRIQHHSRLPLANDPRVRIFVSESRTMEDATMFTLLPDVNTTQDGGFFIAGGIELATNGSHQLGVGLGTDEAKKAALLVTIQQKYDLIAGIEGLPAARVHYEFEIGPLARMGFNGDDVLAGGINRNQPILVADRMRTILAAHMVESEDPDFSTCKPCNEAVPGEPTPDPTVDETPNDEVSGPVLY